MSESPSGRWVDYHLHYHGSPDRGVTHFVAPTVSSLLHSGWIDRFFFVHFSLGGPHIRLRLRISGECGDDTAGAVHAVVERWAGRLFAESPSTRSWEEPRTAAVNRAILAADSFETDDAVYPDNFLRAVPFQPEVERYGGPALLDASLDFFAVSSVAALRFLQDCERQARSRQLIVAWRLLLGQCLGFARRGEELLALLQNPVDSWGEPFPAIAAKSDRVFGEKREALLALFRRELEAPAPSDGAASTLLCEGARRLSWALRDTDEWTHWRIGSSQLHMTANRLGLINAEEAYVGGLLTKTAQEVKEARKELWQALEDSLERRREQSPAGPPPLRDLFLEAFSEAP